MEEIIGLLVALAAIIFKVVGKKLEKSVETTPENMGDSRKGSAGSPFDMKKWLEEVSREIQMEVEPELPVKVMPEPVKPAEEAPRAVVKPAKVSKKTGKKVVDKHVLKEETPQDREKIDPKKLVVYSEIMKPKYLE